MCGIVGAVKLRGTQAWRLSADVRGRMVDALRYRGPDGRGEWISKGGDCWLGHTRLAIIDQAGGHQPMANEDESVWIVFNGEIYNHLELHQELAAAGHRFTSRCDTEVLVHGYEQWGLTELLRRLRGMFAFAIYDAQRGVVSLARDRVGIKPLYYSVADDGTVLFASEIKALLAYPGLPREVDRDALLQYMTFRYVPSPLTMFRGIRKLPAGFFGQYDVRRGSEIALTRYWDVSFKRAEPAPTFAEALEKVDVLLEQSVSSHLMSDVPLGAQLSGGVDSSLIVAHMERLRQRAGSGERVRTFSIGFDAAGFSELPYARQVAQQYGTEHHEIIVGFDDFLREFARLCWVYDEPVSEPAAIPTYLLCRFARQHVTVMLTGEGGDELFGGYPKCAIDQYARYLNWLPPRLRRSLLRGGASLLPFGGRRPRIALENLAIADEGERLASWFSGFDSLALAQIAQPGAFDGHGAAARLREELQGCDSRHPLDRLLYTDLHIWLVDDLLIKGDRMSMASGVEARVPFLDHPLVEYAASLPPAYKARGTRTKILLKKLAERYIPRETIYRRKVGFTVPLTPWFQGPLSRFVREILLGERALGRGYFKPEALVRLVNDHLVGRVDRGRSLWTLLSLEIWHRLFVDDDGSERASERLRDQLAQSSERKQRA
jgi:asparagine synthase (glutamine-hydrolysing)